MKRIGLFFFGAILVGLICVPGLAQNGTSNGASTKSPEPAASSTGFQGGKVPVPAEKSKPIGIPKIGIPMVIDGRLDEEAWRTAAVFKDFYQTGPGYNTAPSRPTEVYMMYDPYNLYIGFKCWDEKDKVRATVAKRDNVFGEDNVRVWLDTYDDQRRAYVLGFNPLGIQQDGMFTETQGADFSVDIVMESKGVIEDWGWSVEVKIPFKSLRYTAGPGKKWGFNAARNIDRFNDEFDQWLPDDRDVSGFLVKHGRITGLDEIKYERTLELIPSMTISETGERVSAREVAAGRFVNHPIKPEFGLNLKYTISPNVTLDAAINPDFAEIEADAPIVSANQRFPIFFPEKRPFFLEGKEIFESPLQPFYSRTIVDPDVAVKLTGKIDKTSFGLLAASDKAPGNYTEDERTRNDQCKERLDLGLRTAPCPLDEFLDKNALFGILRLKRDFGKNNNIGFFGTARTFPQNKNFLGGFDGKYKFNDATVMNFQALGTYSKKNFYDPETDRSRYRPGSGFGYFWNLDYTKDRYGWYAEIFGRTQDYRADSGFTRRTNTNQAFFAFRESTKSRPKATIIRLNFNQFARYTFDWAGRTQYALGGANFNGQLKRNIFVYFEGGYQLEHLYEEEFGAKRNNLPPPNRIAGAFFGAPARSATSPYINWNYNQTVNKQLSFYTWGFLAWGAFDYDFGAEPRYPRVSPAALALGPNAPLDPGPGLLTEYGGGFTYKPIDPFRTSLDYTKSKLRREDTNLLAYDSNIFTFRATYQFTRFTFARAVIDYDTLSTDVRGQYLFGWNPNPGTAIYVGYNDLSSYNGYNPYTGAHEPGIVQDTRKFFIRASYLFRKSF